jgi:hypothetical protein
MKVLEKKKSKGKKIVPKPPADKCHRVLSNGNRTVFGEEVPPPSRAKGPPRPRNLPLSPEIYFLADLSGLSRTVPKLVCTRAICSSIHCKPAHEMPSTAPLLLLES